MRLGIDLGTHYCRAAISLDASQTRLVRLSDLPGDSSGTRLPSLAVVLDQRVLMSEAGLARWGSAQRTERFRGISLTPMLDGEASMPPDAFAYYVARRASHSVARHFHTTVRTATIVVPPALESSDLAIQRALRLAGIVPALLSTEHVLRAELAPPAASSPLAPLWVADWGAAGLRIRDLGSAANARDRLITDAQLGGSALLEMLANRLLEDAKRDHPDMLPQWLRAVVGLRKEACINPPWFLAANDNVSLIGVNADVLPAAGLCRLLCTGIRERLKPLMMKLARWQDSGTSGIRGRCIAVGAMATVPAFVAELSAAMSPMNVQVSAHESPDVCLAVAASRLNPQIVKTPSQDSLASDIAIVRMKDGKPTPLKILNAGDKLPVEWRAPNAMPIAPGAEVTLEIVASQHSEWKALGSLKLTLEELIRAQGAIHARVRADRDGWIAIEVLDVNGTVSIAQDWFPARADQGGAGTAFAPREFMRCRMDDDPTP